jgi:hypothetical protein
MDDIHGANQVGYIVKNQKSMERPLVTYRSRAIETPNLYTFG